MDAWPIGLIFTFSILKHLGATPKNFPPMKDFYQRVLQRIHRSFSRNGSNIFQISTAAWSHTKNSQKLALYSLVCFSLLLTGCRTTGRHVQWYEGTPLASTETALLKVQRGVFKESAIVEAIDGTSVRRGKKSVMNTAKEFELMPGTHSVEFSYVDTDGGHSISNAVLSFACQAGEVYELHVALVNEGFRAALSKAVGGNFKWTAWIVDTKTEEVMAGNRRDEPLHWYEY